MNSLSGSCHVVLQFEHNKGLCFFDNWMRSQVN